jgi:glucose/arabinose dehydrogenase
LQSQHAMPLYRPIVLAIVAFAGLAALGAGAPGMIGHSFRPVRRDATEERIYQLKLPAGFTLEVFARELGDPRMLMVGEDDTVYVSRPDQGDVLALGNGDGRSDGRRTVLSGLDKAHGLALAGNRLYVAGVRKVVAADVLADGQLGAWRTIVDHLPDGGQHGRRTLGVGPGGLLYVSVGSACNACDETDSEHATLLRMRTDGTERSVFARGLRNTIGFAWHPATNELWGMDHGADWRGDDQPPEELNRLTARGDYGWPVCFGNRQPDPFFVSRTISDKEAHCRGTQPPVLTYQAHAAPIALVFYTGRQFPRDYLNDAFVAMHGSWNRAPPTGYKVVRIRFERGRPTRFEDFLTGFLIEDGKAHFGRPAGLAVTRDGALLVSDDTNGVVYRIAYRGDRASAARAGQR